MRTSWRSPFSFSGRTTSDASICWCRSTGSSTIPFWPPATLTVLSKNSTERQISCPYSRALRSFAARRKPSSRALSAIWKPRSWRTAPDADSSSSSFGVSNSRVFAARCAALSGVSWKKSSGGVCAQPITSASAKPNSPSWAGETWGSELRIVVGKVANLLRLVVLDDDRQGLLRRGRGAGGRMTAENNDRAANRVLLVNPIGGDLVVDPNLAALFVGRDDVGRSED